MEKSDDWKLRLLFRKERRKKADKRGAIIISL